MKHNESIGETRLLEVLLGPESEFHFGVHHSLLQQPPSTVRYRPTDGVHTFIWPADAQTPVGGPDLGEFVHFGIGDEFVHAVRWPVLGRAAWVVDLDDFTFPVFYGRFGFNRLFQEKECRRATRSQSFDDCLRRRIQNVLYAFAHDSCKAILFRSDSERHRVEQWLSHLSAPAERDRIVEKASVMYPAMRPQPITEVQAKWTAQSPLRVVFCGRDFSKKNGALALRVFRRLLANLSDVVCTYIGDLPDANVANTSGPDQERIRVLSGLSRDHVLDELARSHVLFHPAHSERLGIVLLEASAHGLAVVAARGPGMEHIGELFEDGAGAVLLDRRSPLPVAEEEERFYRLLESVARNRVRGYNMGLCNHAAASTGHLSLHARDRVLSAAYSKAHSRVAAPIEISDLPSRGLATTSMRSDEVLRHVRDYTGQIYPYAVIRFDL